jgi:hypothetical protein
MDYFKMEMSDSPDRRVVVMFTEPPTRVIAQSNVKDAVVGWVCLL